MSTKEKYNQVIEILKGSTNGEIKTIIEWIQTDMRESSIFSPFPFSESENQHRQ